MSDATTTVQRVIAAVALSHEGGLHARPSIKVTQLAKLFRARVSIGLAPQGPWTDAKSISRVMAMKVPNHTTLYFAAEGEDAHRAVGALVELVGNDFADGSDRAR